MLSVIIPVFNEIHTICEIISRVEAVPLDTEIIIVDDCSNDGTRNILADIAGKSRAKVIFHDRNMGKGASLRTGFSKATGDIVIIQDADLEYDPKEYLKLIQPILTGEADVVYGSRFLEDEIYRSFSLWYLANKILSFLSNIFTGLWLTDMETCFKVFKKEILEKVTIEEDRFGFEPEITAKLAKMNIKISEIGISYDRRSFKDGKKVGWKDGFSALRCILKYNLLR